MKLERQVLKQQTHPVPEVELSVAAEADPVLNQLLHQVLVRLDSEQIADVLFRSRGFSWSQR